MRPTSEAEVASSSRSGASSGAARSASESAVNASSQARLAYDSRPRRSSSAVSTTALTIRGAALGVESGARLTPPSAWRCAELSAKPPSLRGGRRRRAEGLDLLVGRDLLREVRARLGGSQVGLDPLPHLGWVVGAVLLDERRRAVEFVQP